MKFKYLILLSFTTMLTYFGCSTGPDFKRDNKTDPKSGNFKPDVSSLSVKLLNNKTVSLTWIDNSGFEDGIVVAKSLGESGTLVVLDTLSSNSVSYTDRSKLLDLNTTYHVGAFKNGAAPLETSHFISKKLDFGEIQAIDYTSEGNEITLNWSCSLPYVDKFLISEKVSGSSPVVIDTIDGNRTHYTFSVDHTSYSMDVIVSALLVNQNDELISIHQQTKEDVAFNLPAISDLTLVNEAIINLLIDDNSSFNDKFIVYERSRSAWHQSYSDFNPIDTVASSGEILISQIEGNDREYAIEAIYQQEKSGLSDTVAVEFSSRPPYLNEDSFTSVSPTSVKLSWQDRNETESSYATTYQFELSLYNSDTGELLRQIILPPNETQHTLENLSPSVKYEFTLNTYNSYALEPIAFSVQTALEKADEFYMTQPDIVYNPQILANQELIVFSPYQSGASGLKVYDLTTNSTQTIFDTGEEPSEYENKRIENFVFTENLEMIATKRILDDVLEGVFMYVMVNRSGAPAYFKKKIPINSYDYEIHLAGFISDSELIYIANNPYTDEGLKVYKWNFTTNETQLIFERPQYYYASSYIDNNNIMIGAYESLLVLDAKGAVIQEVNNLQYGDVTKIVPSSVVDSYNLNVGGSLYRYNIATNTFERLGDLHRINTFFEVPHYNQIISRTGSTIHFLSLNSGTQIYQINDSEREFRIQNGAYLPNRDQVIFQYGERIQFFNLISNWVTTNFNCC